MLPPEVCFVAYNAQKSISAEVPLTQTHWFSMMMLLCHGMGGRREMRTETLVEEIFPLPRG